MTCQKLEKEVPISHISKLISLTGVYLPFWKRCKMHTLWTDAPHNILFLLGQVRQMTKRVRQIVSSTIQRGSYCCHSETILQALLCSQDEEDRRFAIKKIREIRERLGDPEIGDGGYRERITPKLNFEATTLIELIDWEDVINEPVLTTDIPTGMFLAPTGAQEMLIFVCL